MDILKVALTGSAIFGREDIEAAVLGILEPERKSSRSDLKRPVSLMIMEVEY